MTDEELIHEGTPRHSGRYPWGSGENPNQRNIDFLGTVEKLRKQGLSSKDIADGMGINTTQLRNRITIEKNAKTAADISRAQRLREEGNSNVAIGKIMGIPESSVRALLNPARKERQDVLITTADFLKKQLEEKGGYIDIGEGNENLIGVSQTKLKAAVSLLEDEGYTVHRFKADQLGTGKQTNYKVLAPPDTPWAEVVNNKDRVHSIAGYSEDGGRTMLGIEPPVNVDSKRIAVRYAEDGGADKDGVIELRRGVEDLSLGESRYAQVRIAVDGSHYLKGMAMYTDTVPDGYDMIFNTNKKATGNKLDAMKGLKDDPDNPFGAIIRQKHYLDANGNKKLSPLNIVGTEDPDGINTPGEEGAWAKWSKTLSSQMLSKQSPSLAKQQLGVAYDNRKAEFDEIMALTNPTVKKKLLEKFAEGADSAAIHLKAAGLPGTATHVILPINSLKDNEIYAPQYNNGDRVALIRHPHGGIFEIPELTVNNRNKEGNAYLKNARDAVGINSKVAERLSGADFDGDTVLVIPNNKGLVKSSPPLQALKGFDPKALYPPYDGMPTIDGGKYDASRKKVVYPEKGANNQKQTQMGDVSNLITDMTIQGAPFSEIARAVKHSMVVIDAEKHMLNYKQSAIDNNIKDLKTRYQGKSNAGAATLISRAKSEVRIDERKLRPAAEGGPVDPNTGKLVYVNTGREYYKYDPVTKQPIGDPIKSKTKITKMEAVDDARKLMSNDGIGTKMELVYAEHANRMKSMANEARKEALSTKSIAWNPSARATYAEQVKALDSKLNLARTNKPLERQAQLIAQATLKLKKQSNPGMTSEEIAKVKSQALQEARARMGAGKQHIVITPKEWEAIQAGAISPSKLGDILNNADLDVVKQLAMPRATVAMAPSKISRAKTLLNAGYTTAEVAADLGVSTSTLNAAIK